MLKLVSQYRDCCEYYGGKIVLSAAKMWLFMDSPSEKLMRSRIQAQKNGVGDSCCLVGYSALINKSIDPAEMFF